MGETVYTRFGLWEVDLRVTAALGQGDGRVTFTDNIRPGALNPSEEAALRGEAERVINLQLFFGFDWWPDIVNIIMRIVHSLAGLTLFVAAGLAFSVAWIGVPSNRRRLPNRLKRAFLPVAALSLAVLLGAGLYSAAFDAPIASQGIYDISAMHRIPYGDTYLAAFFIKVALFLLLAIFAVRIHQSLAAWNVEQTGAQAITALRRETLLNAAVGVIVVADVAVLIYLHYISHLGVFLPAP